MDNIQERTEAIKKAMKLPTNTEFLSLCSSFSQYTGKKIKINYLDKPVNNNKFIRAKYDEYEIFFVNNDDMVFQLTGLMYADLREKINSSDPERVNGTIEGSLSYPHVL